MNRQSLTRLLFFLISTLAWSYVFFQIRPISISLENFPAELYLASAWLPAIGLLLVGGFLMRSVPKNDKISLFGGSPKWSLLILSLPIICLTVIGVPNTFGIQANYAGLVFGLVLAVYTLFEEVGWRGYLQQELDLEVRNEWLKYSMIGIAWYLWHWDFLDKTSLMPNLIMCGGLILGSAGIGKIAEKTKSILVCAAFHTLGNIGFMYGLVVKNVALEMRLGIIAVCVVVWVWVIKKWDAEKELKVG